MGETRWEGGGGGGGGVGTNLEEWGEGRFYYGWRGGIWQMLVGSKVCYVPYTVKRLSQSRS
eukprot:13276991-Ditylum_brightwellii.AAC.1